VVSQLSSRFIGEPQRHGDGGVGVASSSRKITGDSTYSLAAITASLGFLGNFIHVQLIAFKYR
jgi:hypothetical protein